MAMPPNQSLNVQLSVPDATREGLSFAEPNNASVKLWLKNIPKANLGEMARQLYFAIQEINQLNTTPERRISFLEQLRPHIHYTCTKLKTHFLGKPLILPEKEQKIARLSEALLHRLLTGYKMAIVQLASQPAGRSAREKLAIAIHRAISESNCVLLHHYQLYKKPSSLFWPELHQMFELAQAIKAQDARVEDRENKTRASITDKYKSTLLLSRAHTNMLRQKEQDKLFEILEKHADKADISTQPLRSAPFAVEYNSNQPLQYRADLSRERTALTLEPAPLLTFLDDAAENKHAQVTDHLLRHLHFSWRDKLNREEQRDPADGQIILSPGFSSAHYHVAGERPFHAILDEDIGEERLQQERSHLLPDESVDIWDQTHIPTVQVHPVDPKEGIVNFKSASNQPINKLELTTCSAHIMDISPRGYKLSINSDIPAQIQAGEILALKRPGRDDWTLGMISWVNLEEDNRILFGIRLWSFKVLPTAVMIYRNNRDASDFLRCFLIPENKEHNQPYSLITPRIPLQAGRKIRLYDGEKLITAKLDKMFLSTNSFCQFLLRPCNALISLDEKPEQPKKHGEFDLLWHDL